MKNRHTPKTLAALILAALMLASSLLTTSCGSDTATASDTTAADSVETTTAETTTARLTPDLPEKTFDGKDYRIYGRDPNGGISYTTSDIWSDGEDGEPLNDAVYNRNRKMEEEYDIKIGFIPHTAPASVLSSAVLAGDDVAELFFDQWNTMQSVATTGALLDLSKQEYIDLDQPWWDQRQIEQTAFLNRVYYIGGELTTRDDTTARIVFFNKKIIEDYNLDDPYELVHNDQWLLDNYIEMGSAVYTDLNGDGVPNEGDRFGTFRENGYQDFLMTGCGYNYVKLDEDGIPYVSFLDDNTFTVLDKIFNFLYNKEACINVDEFVNIGEYLHKFNYGRGQFAQGYLLFTICGPSNIVQFRDMEDEFGMLPTPKYSEQQDGYYAYMDAGSNMAGVPISAADPSFNTYIMEAWAAMSMYEVIPVFYETLLERKYTRDEESMAMLELISDSHVYNLHLVFQIGGLSSITTSAYSAGKLPTMSDFDAVKDSAQTAIDNYIEKYESLPQ